MTRSTTGRPRSHRGPVERPDRHRDRLLAVERSRVLLEALQGRTAPVDLEELGRDVAVRENPAGEPDEEAVERATVMLHHVHLPKLAEFDVVDYDPESNRVESVLAPPSDVL